MTRRLRSIPLRVRVPLAFAGASAVLLTGAGIYIFFAVKSGLDASLDASLRSTAAQCARLARGPDVEGLRRALAVEGEPVQLLSADGRVLLASPRGVGPRRLGKARLRRALRGETLLEHREAVRLIGRPAGPGRIVVASTSMVQRERALEELGRVLLIGGPLILLLSSTAGYLVASGALRPVERMRSRSATISAATPDARLPLPTTHDEIHRLGETLNAMLGRLEQSADQERAFLANASHELRTPRAILKTEVELALHDDATETELRAALASVGEQADRLIGLAEDLLVIAREGHRPLPVDPEPFDLGALACDVARRFTLLGDGTVRSDVEPGLLIRGDRSRLERALGNLVDNALRHGSAPIVLRAVRTETDIELHVSDRGKGFSAARFAGPSTRVGGTSAGGFGLGLPIVASIVQAHGGTLTTTNTTDGAGVEQERACHSQKRCS